jgi:hypothetical protein
MPPVTRQPRRLTDEDSIAVEPPRSPWDMIKNVGALLGALAVAATVIGSIYVTNADVAEMKPDVKANTAIRNSLPPEIRALTQQVQRLNNTLDKMDERCQKDRDDNLSEHQKLWRFCGSRCRSGSAPVEP